MMPDPPTQLSTALELIDVIVEKRSTIPILGNALLTCDGTALVVEGTDLDIEASITFPFEGKPFAASAGIEPLVKAVAYFGGEATLVARDEQTRLIVGDMFELPCLNPDDFPRMATFAERWTFELDPFELRENLRRVRSCVSTEETRYYLNGVYVHTSGEPRVLKFAATDGHRLACVSQPWADGPPVEAILPRKLIKFLIQALTAYDDCGPVHFRFGGESLGGASKVEITFGPVAIRSKCIDGKFPDYTRVIPKDEAGALIVNPDALIRGAKGAGVINGKGDRTRSVILSFTDKTLKAVNVENGIMRIPMPGTREGNLPDQIGMNADYLATVLGSFTDLDEVRLSFNGPADPVRFSSPGGQLVGVLMPMRV